MTYSDPNSPYEPPPRDNSTMTWMAGAIIVLLLLAGVVYAFTNRAEQTASNGVPVTTGQNPGDSRMAPPPPAPVK